MGSPIFDTGFKTAKIVYYSHSPECEYKVNIMATGVDPTYRDEIVDYYDNCEVDYRLLWRLDRCLSLHYGYWDETTERVSEALIREIEILSQRAGISADDRVLDAGCGVGGSAIWLANEVKCAVTGITLSAHQVEECCKNAEARGVAENTEFQVADFTATGFDDASYDVVWAIESVCHAENKQDFINEAFRLLKPGGRLILADFFATKDDFNAEEQKLMDDWLSGWSVKSLAYTPDFHSGLQAAGFSDIDYQNATDNVRPSAKELYQYSVAVQKASETATFGRTERQDGNVRAVYCQYPALEEGLWSYGIFLARKPK